MMSGCKRTVFLVFGTLLVLAFIIIPYNSTHITYKTDPYSRNKLRITAKKSGYLLLPQYLILKSRKPQPLKAKSPWSPDEDIGSDLYEFNLNLFIIEIVIIILAGCFDYIIFCVVLKKPKRKREV